MENVETFQLTKDCKLFCDKGVFRRTPEFFLGSYSKNLCYKISLEIFELMSPIVEYLKCYDVNTTYEKVSCLVTYEQYLTILNKLDDLGFNDNSSHNISFGFDETEISMIRLFSVKGKFLDFCLPVKLKQISILYFTVLLILIPFTVFTVDRLGLERISNTQLEIIPYLIAYLISYSFHEIAHIMVSRLLHIPIKSITLAFYFDIIPVIFIKYDKIRFFERRKRVCVSLAGVSINLILFCIGILFSSIDILNALGTAMTYVNMMMMISCLIPLKLGDGYFAICDLFGLDNLRQYIFNLLEKKRNVKVSKINILYLSAFIVFNIIAISLQMVALYKTFCNSTLLLRIILLVYVLFSVLICGIVTIKRIWRRRLQSNK